MFGKLNLRAKILIGMALACAGYVALMPDSTQTIEPTHDTAAAPAPHVIRAAPGGHKSPLMNASYRMSDRIVKDAAAASLFSPHSWFVAPPPPPPPPPAAPAAPPVPTAPPLPFVFMGSYKAQGAKTYFLTAGDRVYDVKIGDTLDNTYSVDGVKAGQLMLTYMPLKIQQSLAVGEE
ncbi:MAG: hypothetical protein ABJC66_16100 [Gammaproteobacteria bacterium]